MPVKLEAAAAELAEASRGEDYSPRRVQAAIDAIHKAGRRASGKALNAAAETLVARLRQYHPARHADASGYVAIAAGSLVEFGADPAPLADVLVDLVPQVLAATRRQADVCLADRRTPKSMPDDEHEPGELAGEIDCRPILWSVFRRHMNKDLPAAYCLMLHGAWTLAATTAWTRHRPALIRAQADKTLVKWANKLANSEVHSLCLLLAAPLDAVWLVLCPVESRGFEVRVDGITSNFDLHALLAAAIVPCGIAGETNSKSVIAYLEGRAKAPRASGVMGTWNLYDYRAVNYDLRNEVDEIPLDDWVWGEGVPGDVPLLDGMPTIVLGPETIIRHWGLCRPFCALQSRVTVIRELSRSEYQGKIDRAKNADRARQRSAKTRKGNAGKKRSGKARSSSGVRYAP